MGYMERVNKVAGGLYIEDCELVNTPCSQGGIVDPCNRPVTKNIAVSSRRNFWLIHSPYPQTFVIKEINYT
jgi:hypothetical protein